MATPTTQRVVIAHDLPMELDELAHELLDLGEGWYLPRDPHLLIEEVVAAPGPVLVARTRDGGWRPQFEDDAASEGETLVDEHGRPAAGRPVMRKPRWLYPARSPEARALNVLGEKWTLLIIRALLLHGPQRFVTLQRDHGSLATMPRPATGSVETYRHTDGRTVSFYLGFHMMGPAQG